MNRQAMLAVLNADPGPGVASLPGAVVPVGAPGAGAGGAESDAPVLPAFPVSTPAPPAAPAPAEAAPPAADSEFRFDDELPAAPPAAAPAPVPAEAVPAPATPPARGTFDRAPVLAAVAALDDAALEKVLSALDVIKILDDPNHKAEDLERKLFADRKMARYRTAAKFVSELTGSNGIGFAPTIDDIKLAFDDQARLKGLVTARTTGNVIEFFSQLFRLNDDGSLDEAQRRLLQGLPFFLSKLGKEAETRAKGPNNYQAYDALARPIRDFLLDSLMKRAVHAFPYSAEQDEAKFGYEAVLFSLVRLFPFLGKPFPLETWFKLQGINPDGTPIPGGAAAATTPQTPEQIELARLRAEAQQRAQADADAKQTAYVDGWSDGVHAELLGPAWQALAELTTVDGVPEFAVRQVAVPQFLEYLAPYIEQDRRFLLHVVAPLKEGILTYDEAKRKGAIEVHITIARDRIKEHRKQFLQTFRTDVLKKAAGAGTGAASANGTGANGTGATAGTGAGTGTTPGAPNGTGTGTAGIPLRQPTPGTGTGTAPSGLGRFRGPEKTMMEILRTP